MKVDYNGNVILTTDVPIMNGVACVEYLHGTIYVKKTYPAADMTSNESQGCSVTASSVFSASFPVYYAFDTVATHAWVSNGAPVYDSTSYENCRPQWVQITLPNKMRNISVTVTSRNNTAVSAPTRGNVYVSNDISNDESAGGSSSTYQGRTDMRVWKKVGEYSGWSNTQNAVLGTVQCTDILDASGNPVGARHIRFEILERGGAYAYAAIGNIKVSGILM